MPVDYQQIQSQVKLFGEKAVVRQRELKNLRQEALVFLAYHASRQAALQEKIARAVEQSPGLRCAMPTNEAINAHFPLPKLPFEGTFLAADGSQINPNRHARVEYCVINVGVICYYWVQACRRRRPLPVRCWMTMSCMRLTAV
jgi:hypothetical protein